MNDSVFIDTNVFVYMQRGDDPVKQQIARDVIDRFACVANTQVINEVCNIFTRKYPVALEKVEQIINAIFETCEMEFVFAETARDALHLMKRYNYSYYDCLMLASALKHGCAHIFTEDMSDGQSIEGTLQIVNIFAHPDRLTR